MLHLEVVVSVLLITYGAYSLVLAKYSVQCCTLKEHEP
jgi:hypothetical protein